ncbi:MAG TPA: RNB domain-containing ribonuclease [Chloroflexota bacterium]|nr:RNB domain-containing ribonuclease [Chloroflexota bacterium]
MPPEVLRQAAETSGPTEAELRAVRDLRDLPWCSTDNDDTRDLDQLTVARPDDDGRAAILVAIADVDALVRQGSAIDRQAQRNTVSVYTPAINFPLLPERLSTDLTSLVEGEDRLAVVVEMVVDRDGEIGAPKICRVRVHNRAKLTYAGVAAWLDGDGPIPPTMARVPELDAQIRLQDEVAQRLNGRRHERGALERTPASMSPRVERACERSEGSHRQSDLVREILLKLRMT